MRKTEVENLVRLSLLRKLLLYRNYEYERLARCFGNGQILSLVLWQKHTVFTAREKIYKIAFARVYTTQTTKLEDCKHENHSEFYLSNFSVEEEKQF
jgi:hypothetical protein